MSVEEKMYSLVEMYEGSGQSLREFCEAHDLKRTTFYYWLKKKRGLTRKATKAGNVGGFVKVSKPKASVIPAGLAVEVSYGNGVQLKASCRSISEVRALVTLLSDV